MVLPVLVSVVVVTLSILLIFYKWRFQYWKRRNMPYIEPQIPFGNMTNPLRESEHISTTIERLYKQIKKNKWKHAGIYSFLKPIYLVVDLDYIKNVMTKDFEYFVDRGVYYNEKDDLLSNHLINIGGNQWRKMRTKLTTTFSSGKIKMMFQIFIECQENLMKRMDKECEKKQAILIRNVLECYATDIIGSCAFGLDWKSFEDDDSSFRVYGRKIFSVSKLRFLLRTFGANFPDLARKMGVLIYEKEITDFFTKVVKDNVEYREKNNYTRNDFMQLLINMKNSDGDETMTFEELAAQCFVFFLANFETITTTLIFSLYLLGKHQDVQQKLRDEINTVLSKTQGKITYESLQDMKYMDKVLDESLRLYPAPPLVARKCTQDYKIPGENITIEKGTSVIIPILAIQHDEEYYPDPEKFDPERFTEENKKSRPHYAYIPFGEGPRYCIGMRFGLVQTKVALASLIKNYNFTVNEKTKEPIQFNVKSFTLAVDGDLWLNAQKI